MRMGAFEQLYRHHPPMTDRSPSRQTSPRMLAAEGPSSAVPGREPDECPPGGEAQMATSEVDEPRRTEETIRPMDGPLDSPRIGRDRPPPPPTAASLTLPLTERTASHVKEEKTRPCLPYTLLTPRGAQRTCRLGFVGDLLKSKPLQQHPQQRQKAATAPPTPAGETRALPFYPFDFVRSFGTNQKTTTHETRSAQRQIDGDGQEKQTVLRPQAEREALSGCPRPSASSARSVPLPICAQPPPRRGNGGGKSSRRPG